MKSNVPVDDVNSSTILFLVDQSIVKILFLVDQSIAKILFLVDQSIAIWGTKILTVRRWYSNSDSESIMKSLLISSSLPQPLSAKPIQQKKNKSYTPTEVKIKVLFALS